MRHHLVAAAPAVAGARAGRALLRLVLLVFLLAGVAWIARDLATRYFLDRGGSILRANLAREKDARRALEWLRLAEYTDPKNPLLHLYMGLYHTKVGDGRAAEAEFRQFGDLAEKDLGYFIRVLYATREAPGASAPASATASVGAIVVSTSTRPPPLPNVELEANDVSPPTAVLFAWMGIQRMDRELTKRALERAAPLEGRSYQFHFARAVWAFRTGERRQALEELERAFALRDGDKSDGSLGVGLLPFAFWLERHDGDIAPQVGPWIGQLVTQPDAANALTAEMLAAMAVMGQHRQEYRRSIQWAELARKRYAVELERLGLVEHVDRMVWPLSYSTFVAQASRKYHVDPLLVFSVIREESHFNSSANSRVSARGLMQLMPKTAAWIAQMMKWSGYNDELLQNPSDNIEFGTYYLAYLRQALGGGEDALPWVLAAYNGGIGNVKKWLALKETSGGPDVEAIAFKETRDYIMKVTGSLKQYRRLYGSRLAELDLPAETVTATDAALAGAALPEADAAGASPAPGASPRPKKSPRKKR